MKILIVQYKSLDFHTTQSLVIVVIIVIVHLHSIQRKANWRLTGSTYYDLLRCMLDS